MLPVSWLVGLLVTAWLPHLLVRVLTIVGIGLGIDFLRIAGIYHLLPLLYVYFFSIKNLMSAIRRLRYGR
ncbi:MAG: hypothetical protein IPP15_19330 [Saprospiraceae bacterium]|uniref:Uncharacterized protein n=1 Tax=Candidatus Opimibacter skivensis TaxID=2982028 RepID=A0A9D7XPH5_9BACT|nr:hypothetical protein [Candidatus Opimibacter skivensis]